MHSHVFLSMEIIQVTSPALLESDKGNIYRHCFFILLNDCLVGAQICKVLTVPVTHLII